MKSVYGPTRTTSQTRALRRETRVSAGEAETPERFPEAKRLRDARFGAQRRKVTECGAFQWA